MLFSKEEGAPSGLKGRRRKQDNCRKKWKCEAPSKSSLSTLTEICFNEKIGEKRGGSWGRVDRLEVPLKNNKREENVTKSFPPTGEKKILLKIQEQGLEGTGRKRCSIEREKRCHQKKADE